MAKTKLRLFLLFSLSLRAFPQTETYFAKGAQEFGLSNVGIGHSSSQGLIVSANARYQYYVLNRFSLGGAAFYNNFNDREWIGAGPVASYILFTYRRWFSRFDQQVTAAKFTDFPDDPATLYGTSSIGLNYLPEMSRFFIGGGYSHTYALNHGRIITPNAFQLFAGWFF
jgi:hypothetical protein